MKPLTQLLSSLGKPNHEQAISEIPRSITVCAHPKPWLPVYRQENPLQNSTCFDIVVNLQVIRTFVAHLCKQAYNTNATDPSIYFFRAMKKYSQIMA